MELQARLYGGMSWMVSNERASSLQPYCIAGDFPNGQEVDHLASANQIRYPGNTQLFIDMHTDKSEYHVFLLSLTRVAMKAKDLVNECGSQSISRLSHISTSSRPTNFPTNASKHDNVVQQHFKVVAYLDRAPWSDQNSPQLSAADIVRMEQGNPGW